MFSGAFAIALMGLIEASAISRTIATESGGHLDNNQNLSVRDWQASSAVLSGFPVPAHYHAQSSITMPVPKHGGNHFRCFDRRFVAGFAPLAPHICRVPHCLAYSSLPAGILSIAKKWFESGVLHAETALIMMATFAATLLIPLRFAFVAGVAVSFLRYIRRTSTPMPTVLPTKHSEHFCTISDDRPVCPQLVS